MTQDDSLGRSMCVIALVLSQEKPPRCPRICPVGYVCEFGVCVKRPCCWIGNNFKNCYWCPRPLTCYKGLYCYYVPPPTKPTNKTTTPKKPKECCWPGNGFKNCYPCKRPLVCRQGKYCIGIVPSSN
uniref:Uncharacterized protein n=1 Tax=Meloidogyne incognita TaxID=6306 RepID=A0A914KPC5_MELIC